VSNQKKLDTYKQLELKSRVDDASPHRLIQMLLEGALSAIAEAQGAMSRGHIVVKGERITRAINIVSGLRDSLKPEGENTLPYDLDRLYEYMQHRLLEAHAQNEGAGLVEVSELLLTIKSGWDDISP